MSRRGLAARAALIAWPLLSVVGCKREGTPGGGGSIHIAAVAPITGSQGEVGQDLINGIRLAVDEVNRTGGVLGRQVALEVLDDAADPRQAVTVAQRILADSTIAGIVGHMNSGTTKPASAHYGPAGIPVVMPVPTNPEITQQGYRNLFRIPPTDFQQGEAVADYALNRAGKRRFAIIHDNTDYGRPLAEVVRRRIEQGGGTVVAFEGITEGDRDFRAVLTRVRRLSPEAIFFGGIYNEAGLIARQSRQLGINALFLAADGSYGDKFVEIAGLRSAEGAVMSFIAPPLDSGDASSFARVFATRYGSIKAFAPLGYDAARVLLAAITRAGSTERHAIVNVLHDSSFTYRGVTGAISFGQNGDNQNRQLFFYVVRNGVFVPVPTSEPRGQAGRPSALRGPRRVRQPV